MAVVTSFASRLAGGAWIIGAALLGVSTALFLPTAVLTVPWALTMLWVGIPLFRNGYDQRRNVLSVILAVISVLITAASPDQDTRAFFVAPGVAGIASAVALAVGGRTRAARRT
jgi:hypothetical protein